MPGRYAHSGSQKPFGRRPRWRVTVSTPISTCARTAFGVSISGRNPCVAAEASTSRCPASWISLNAGDEVAVVLAEEEVAHLPEAFEIVKRHRALAGRAPLVPRFLLRQLDPPVQVPPASLPEERVGEHLQQRGRQRQGHAERHALVAEPVPGQEDRDVRLRDRLEEPLLFEESLVLGMMDERQVRVQHDRQMRVGHRPASLAARRRRRRRLSPRARGSASAADRPAGAGRALVAALALPRRGRAPRRRRPRFRRMPISERCARDPHSRPGLSRNRMAHGLDDLRRDIFAALAGPADRRGHFLGSREPAEPRAAPLEKLEAAGPVRRHAQVPVVRVGGRLEVVRALRGQVMDADHLRVAGHAHFGLNVPVEVDLLGRPDEGDDAVLGVGPRQRLAAINIRRTRGRRLRSSFSWPSAMLSPSSASGAPEFLAPRHAFWNHDDPAVGHGEFFPVGRQVPPDADAAAE